MHTHLSDWYKVLDLDQNPGEALFEKRSMVLTEIRKLVLDAEEWNYVVAVVAGVTGGFELVGEDADFTSAVIQSHKSHLLSFQSHLADNSLELRVSCGAIIEEIITDDLNTDEDGLPMVTALLLQSATKLASQPSERYLADNLNRLNKAAENYLEKKAQELRHRATFDFAILEEISSPPAEEEEWITFRDQLVSILRAFEQKTNADREELELLWWLQSGYSKKLKQPFANLSPICTAIYAGLEVSEMVMLPPINSTFAVVRNAVEKNKGKQFGSAKALPQWVTSREIKSWKLLAPTRKGSYTEVSACPSIFPLSWLGLQLKEDSSATSWQNDFETRTGLSITKPLTPAEIAEQIYREQIAIRAINP